MLSRTSLGAATKRNPFDWLAARACQSVFAQLASRERQKLELALRPQRAQLARVLYRTAKPCLELRMSACLEAARALKIEHREHYLDELQNPSELCRCFPALASLLSRLVNQWQRNVLELAQRLMQDERELSLAFFNGQPLGALTWLDCNLSDPHDGGRSVARLQFERGSVIYKPRNGQCEHEWALLLRWLRLRGLEPSLRALRVIRRRRYCWMEYAKAEPCPEQGEACRYFRRLGALICLTHLLAGVDFHRGNLITAGEHPLLVDAETLCHPKSETPGANRIIPKDLLRTGWFRSKSYRFGPLGFARTRMHSPHVSGLTLDYRDFIPEIRTGFINLWNLLLKEPTDRRAIQRRRRRLERQSWRQLLRTTRFYQAVQQASLEPRLMACPAARYQFIVTNCRSGNCTPALLKKEAKALFWLDIPYFERRCELPALPAYNDLAETTRLLSHILRGEH